MCSSFTCLSNKLLNFPSLQKKTFNNCNRMTSLEDQLKSLFVFLEILLLDSWLSLISLPHELANLSLLQVLYLNKYPNLTSLPNEITNYSSLKETLYQLVFKLLKFIKKCKKTF